MFATNSSVFATRTIMLLCVASFSATVLAQPAPPYGESADRPDPAVAVVADPALADFDKFVEEQLKRWNTPGAAITVVKDGKVILKRGYGLRNVEKKLPMTALTVQPIASVTKSFTVASLATLVRDGKLAWDRPTREFMPDFRLSDDYLTANVTPRDMLSHRTGLPRHDWSWFNSSASREDLYKRLRHFEASAQLRTTFQYNNFMFMTAGYMGGKLAGSDWETLVRKGIFEPLGMRSSNFAISDLLKAQDHGTGYKWDKDEKPVALSYTPLDAMGPTGSINSNVEDMSRYLLMYLGNGMFEGKRVINAADIVEMTNPQMVMSDARLWPEIAATQYGMGFFLTHYRGERLVHHGGNMPGASSLLSFMPQRGVGVFTTVNMSSSPLPSILSYAVYDRLLGMKPIDWSGRNWDRKEKTKASEEAAKKQNLTPRKANTKPAHPLDEYVADYENKGYGVMSVTRDAATNELRLTYNGFTGALKHYHFEMFEVPNDKINELGGNRFTFVTNDSGEVSAIRGAIEPAVKPIEFARLPDKRFTDPKFLGMFAGEYELGPTRVIIALREDNVLTMSIAGQPTRELVGNRDTKFNVRNLSGFSIEFVRDKSGAVTQAAFYQPNGNFVADRSTNRSTSGKK
ncbi:MAG: serine hydrolase [Burkholderiales bacterium]